MKQKGNLVSSAMPAVTEKMDGAYSMFVLFDGVYKMP